MTPEDFIESLKPYCLPVKQRGYFPSVFLAQAALESGWGASPLAKVNNLWGHKWKSELDKGRYDWINKLSDEEINSFMIPEDSRFRVYRDMNSAVQAYCDKWEERWPDGTEKYPNQDHSSPPAFIVSVAPKYCNDGKYVTKLKSIIARYILTRFD